MTTKHILHSSLTKTTNIVKRKTIMKTQVMPMTNMLMYTTNLPSAIARITK
jgi:hypothetical protein